MVIKHGNALVTQFYRLERRNIHARDFRPVDVDLLVNFLGVIIDNGWRKQNKKCTEG